VGAGKRSSGHMGQAGPLAGHRLNINRAAVLLLCMCALLAAIPGLPARAAGDSEVRLLGRLPEPPAAKRVNQRIIQLDAVGRKMYYVWREATQKAHVVEYDLKQRIPQPMREAVVADFPTNTSSYLTTLDSRRRDLLFVDIWKAPSTTLVHRFDLKSFTIKETWDLTTKVPGFEAFGITYAPQDDRIYLIGDISLTELGHDLPATFFARPPVAPPTAIVALDAKDGSLQWIRPIPECLQVLSIAFVGGFIGRSTSRDALYFFCFSGGAVGVTFPGVTGLVRMSIGRSAKQADAVDFPIEFFPVSGAFTGSGPNAVGGVGMDHPTDRVFVQSLSTTTPGAWVFDGNISAWVGLIAAPDAADQFLAVNEGTGHYYIGSDPYAGRSRYLVVSNARMTPPPQGDVYRFSVGGDLFADAGSHRLFATFYDNKDQDYFVNVLEDNSPDPQPLQPVDYDDLTTDIAEGSGTVSTYSGSLNGFGARAFLVGGVGGARSFAQVDDSPYKPFLDALQQFFSAPVPALSPGDRGVFLSRVASVDLRNSGATASAQGAALDTLTDQDVKNLRILLETTPAKPAAQALVWPYPPAACLDGSSEPLNDDQAGPGGDAKATCDLAKSSSTASASFHPLVIGPLTIGASSFSAASGRDSINGAFTRATAIAKGIELALPGVGSLSIARVTAVSVTFAHGRPGTARVEYTRRIQDVTVSDANGKETFSCQASCNPEDVAAAVNDNLGVKVRMEVLPPEIVKTARGAFAGVEKTYRDYVGGLAQNNDNSRALPALQLTINNDSASKSRVMVQLAAIQASSIYGISLLPAEGLGSLPIPPSILPPIIGPPPIPPEVLPEVIVPRPAVRTVSRLRGAFLFARSPRDVAVVALILALIAGTIATAYRRQMLIEHLEGDNT
jgi:hypothetical protein